MLSSEPLKDLSSAPVSRRTVAAGLWAAPVVALVAAAPAIAASGTHSLTVTATGCISNVSMEFTVRNSGTTTVPEGAIFNVTLPAGMSVKSIAGGSAPSGTTTNLPSLAPNATVVLTVELTGTVGNSSDAYSVTASATGTSLTATPATRAVKKDGNKWACA